MKVLRWGVLGTARIAEQQVIPAIQAAKNADLVAVASRRREQGEAFAQRLQIPKTFTSYEALLESNEVDAVYIPLPNHMHREWTIRAAQQGKHVLCEKPIGLNSCELEDVVEAGRENRVVIAEAFMYHYHSQWSRVTDLIAQGAIGDIRGINGCFSFRLDNPDDIRLNPDFGGGSLYDVGCYCVHVINQLTLDTELVEVRAIAEFQPDGIVDRSLAAVLRFANGIVAHFDSSFDMPARQRVEIGGTAGSIAVTLPFRPDTGKPVIQLCDADGHIEEIPMEQTPMYQLQIEDFSRAVLTGTQPKNTLEMSLRNMRMLDAIYAASHRS